LTNKDTHALPILGAGGDDRRLRAARQLPARRLGADPNAAARVAAHGGGPARVQVLQAHIFTLLSALSIAGSLAFEH
jgi:hypothetical protein